jgi:hypothetical protein
VSGAVELGTKPSVGLIHRQRSLYISSTVERIISCCLALAGKGLILVGSVIEGTFATNKERAEQAKKNVGEMMKKEKTKGFADVIVSKDTSEGLSYL